MVYLITALHVIICFFLIIVVLLQSGKAADLAGAFGGMGSQTVFGPRGTATVLSKATTIAASLFMITALTLAVMSTRTAPGSGSVLQNTVKPKPKTGNVPGSPVPITVTPNQKGAPMGQPSVKTGVLKPGETAPTPEELNGGQPLPAPKANPNQKK